MTTETPVHPRILDYVARLQERLVALETTPGEVFLSARILVRNGVPRKVKWNLEDEEEG